MKTERKQGNLFPLTIYCPSTKLRATIKPGAACYSLLAIRWNQTSGDLLRFAKIRHFRVFLGVAEAIFRKLLCCIVGIVYRLLNLLF